VELGEIEHRPHLYQLNSNCSLAKIREVNERAREWVRSAGRGPLLSSGVVSSRADPRRSLRLPGRGGDPSVLRCRPGAVAALA
jgi:hypothetical protein